MAKTIPLYPFLLALYPILTLYSRNPGEIPGSSVIRPASVAIAFTVALIGAFVVLFRKKQKAYLISALVIFYFSSSGHVYRIIKGYLFPNLMWDLHPALVILEILLIALIAYNGIWDKYVPEKRSRSITGYANLFALVMLIYPVILIVRFSVNSNRDIHLSRDAILSPDTDQQILSVSTKPDIYLIVLDGYGRNDVLENIYSLDNSAFTDALKKRGFLVAEKSHSNYMQTPLSFASFLNFSYIDITGSDLGRKSINRLPLFPLIENAKSISLLKEIGYDVVTTESGFQFTELEEADAYYSPFASSLSTFERFFLSTTALDAFSGFDNPISRFVQTNLAIPGYSTHRENVLFSLDALTKTIPPLSSPKLVIIHIVSPHPPFVLNKAGNSIIPNRPYLPGDGEAFGGNSREYQQQYVEQLEYINARTLLAIDSILAGSTTPPIIILQGDHGPGSLLRRDNIIDTCIWERSSILNAYYMPEYNNADLYPEITPVNTFRVIFNTYFGTDFELLPDRTYFSPQSYPYDFIDVTAQSNTPCANSQ